MQSLRDLLTGPRFTLLAIILGNLIPVMGVAFLGWDATQILIIYWAENIIIGLLTLPRILAARGDALTEPGKPKDSPGCIGCFFVVHYGVFCLGHAVFAFMLANSFIEREGPGAPDAWTRTFGDPAFWWAILAIAIVNLVIQVRDWWLPSIRVTSWNSGLVRGRTTFEVSKAGSRMMKKSS